MYWCFKVVCTCNLIACISASRSNTLEEPVSKETPLFMLSNGSFNGQHLPMNPMNNADIMARYRKARIYLSNSKLKKQAQHMRAAEKSNITLGADCLHKLRTDDVSTRSHHHTKHNGTKHRRKRQSSSMHDVELVLFLDYALYLFWLGRNNNNSDFAKAEMLDYYANVINTVNRRFVSVSQNGFSVQLLTNAIVIADTASLSPWTQNLNSNGVIQAGQALDDFSDYVESTGGQINGIPFDHVALITGFDLASGSSKATAGIAYLRAVCSTFTVSITQELFEELTAVVLAHEIGHSLGSDHDGVQNACNQNDLFIMAAILGIPDSSRASNPWHFSSCSITQFRSYLDTPQTACTKSRQGNSIDLSPYLQQEFGQKYPPDIQCEIHVGPGSKLCRTLYFGPSALRYESMCRLLFCFRPSTGDCIPVSAHDGTSCGDHFWCQTGVCGFSINAPSRPINCPAGDDPDVFCSLDICKEALFNDQLCCDTCRRTSQILSPVTQSAVPGTDQPRPTLSGFPIKPTQSIIMKPPKPTQSMFRMPPRPTQSMFRRPPRPTQSMFRKPPRPTQSMFRRPHKPTQSRFPRPTQSILIV